MVLSLWTTMQGWKWHVLTGFPTLLMSNCRGTPLGIFFSTGSNWTGAEVAAGGCRVQAVGGLWEAIQSIKDWGQDKQKYFPILYCQWKNDLLWKGLLRALWYLLRLSPGCGVVNWNSQDSTAGCWCAPPSGKTEVLHYNTRHLSSNARLSLHNDSDSECSSSSVSRKLGILITAKDEEYPLASSNRRSASVWLLHLGLYL